MNAYTSGFRKVRGPLSTYSKEFGLEIGGEGLLVDYKSRLQAIVYYGYLFIVNYYDWPFLIYFSYFYTFDKFNCKSAVK